MVGRPGELAEEAPYGWPREKFQWLDDEHCYAVTRSPRGDASGAPVGLNEFHRVPVSDRVPSGWCGGWVPFAGTDEDFSDLGSPAWELTSIEPLTISPSVLCRMCGEHGFIRDGRWVPA